MVICLWGGELDFRKLGWDLVFSAMVLARVVGDVGGISKAMYWVWGAAGGGDIFFRG